MSLYAAVKYENFAHCKFFYFWIYTKLYFAEEITDD